MAVAVSHKSKHVHNNEVEGFPIPSVPVKKAPSIGSCWNFAPKSDRWISPAAIINESLFKSHSFARICHPCRCIIMMTRQPYSCEYGLMCMHRQPYYPSVRLDENPESVSWLHQLCSSSFTGSLRNLNTRSFLTYLHENAQRPESPHI